MAKLCSVLTKNDCNCVCFICCLEMPTLCRWTDVNDGMCAGERGFSGGSINRADLIRTTRNHLHFFLIFCVHYIHLHARIHLKAYCTETTGHCKSPAARRRCSSPPHEELHRRREQKGRLSSRLRVRAVDPHARS